MVSTIVIHNFSSKSEKISDERYIVLLRPPDWFEVGKR